MPNRPTALQKVYVKELFFFGHSLRICPGEETETDEWAPVNMCAHRQAAMPRDVVNVVRRHRCTPVHGRRVATPPPGGGVHMSCH